MPGDSGDLPRQDMADVPGDPPGIGIARDRADERSSWGESDRVAAKKLRTRSGFVDRIDTARLLK